MSVTGCEVMVCRFEPMWSHSTDRLKTADASPACEDGESTSAGELSNFDHSDDESCPDEDEFLAIRHELDVNVREWEETMESQRFHISGAAASDCVGPCSSAVGGGGDAAICEKG